MLHFSIYAQLMKIRSMSYALPAPKVGADIDAEATDSLNTFVHDAFCRTRNIFKAYLCRFIER
jgi:hypothetical protein